MDPLDPAAQLEALHRESFAWALSCCGGRWAEAEDVLQTVYLHVLEEKARFGGQSSFKTWLFSVIRNRAAKEMRRQMVRRLFLQRQEEEPAPLPASPAPDASLETAELQSAFERALEALPRRQREVLHLVFYEGLSLSEAAQVMAVSLGSARQHYHRAKLKMREEFEPQMENLQHERRN